MGSISRHITPLVISSLGDGHTDTHTHIHTLRGQDQYLETRRMPAFGRHAPGLKMLIEIILWTRLAMMQFISQDMQPIAVVDGSGFHNLIAVAEPRFVVPSRTYFMQIGCMQI